MALNNLEQISEEVRYEMFHLTNKTIDFLFDRFTSNVNFLYVNQQSALKSPMNISNCPISVLIIKFLCSIFSLFLSELTEFPKIDLSDDSSDTEQSTQSLELSSHSPQLSKSIRKLRIKNETPLLTHLFGAHKSHSDSNINFHSTN